MIPFSPNFKTPGGSGNGGATSVNISAKTMNQETAENPRFLVVKRLDGADFSKVSPFLIHKSVYGLIGEAKSVKKIGEGLLIETASSAQSKRLLKVERLAEFPVVVNAHGSLNSSRGVIYCRDLLNCSVSEIEENLKEKGVTNVRRIQVKREGVLIDTPNLILTFNTPNLPKYINAAMYRLEVRPFIPNPMRCFRCQQFGHTSSRCSREEICICGKSKHEGSSCEAPVCVNCKGDHFAQDKGCPKYKEEAAIQRVKITQNVDYREAKKRVVTTTPTPGISYAQSVQFTLKDSLKDIIDEIIPEVVKICTSLIKDGNQPPGPQSFRKVTSGSLSKTTLTRSKITGPITREQDKRKAEESDESEDIQSSSSQAYRPTKRKPGRPPKVRPQSQDSKKESETETMDLTTL